MNPFTKNGFLLLGLFGIAFQINSQRAVLYDNGSITYVRILGNLLEAATQEPMFGAGVGK